MNTEVKEIVFPLFELNDRVTASYTHIHLHTQLGQHNNTTM